MLRKATSLPAITHGVNPTDYRKIGEEFARGDVRRTMNVSQLREFSRCPHRWKVGGEIEKEETTSLEWGSLLDCIVTTPDRFDGMMVPK